MSEVNRGLNLSTIGNAKATDAEKGDFRKFYKDVMGRPHPGLEFFLNNAPDTMKRYRAFADAATPRNLDTDKRLGGFGFMTYYALTGYVEGVWYLVYISQQLGMSKSMVMEGLGISFLHAGPRGSETIAKALDDYPWIEPTATPQFPDGWARDPGAFTSGLDFEQKDLSQDELKMLEDWYVKFQGEVPGYVPFMARHNPVMLKAYRNRWEHLIDELPKQVLPTSLLHYDISRAHGPGIRENIQLARGFGVTKEQVLRTVLAPTINSGVETLTLVDQVAGDLLADESWE